jgi:hypothetical protein
MIACIRFMPSDALISGTNTLLGVNNYRTRLSEEVFIEYSKIRRVIQCPR